MTGNDYEAEFMTGLKDSGVDVKRSTHKEDLFAGTDLFIEGIPVDVTSAFSTKDNMAITRYIKRLGMYMGIRTGNSHVKFKEPVVVVGNSYDPNYCNAWIIPNLAEEVRKNAQYIADEVSDTYWAYEDSLEES